MSARQSLYVLLGLVLAAAIFRLLPHPANVAPIAAMALFCGCYLQDKRLAFVVPLLALLLSDLVLGFYAGIVYVYLGFALVVLLGFWLRGRDRWVNILGASVTASLIFFLVSNFSAWMVLPYPATFAGLGEAYLAGIPFLRNSMLGDLFFTVCLFGLWRAAHAGLPRLLSRV